MPTVAVMADPPVEGAVATELAAEAPLSEFEASTLYEAMLGDVCRGVQLAGAELLVNYRPPEQVDADVDPEASLREALSDVLEEPDEARYEVQVGETFAGRAGNTATHLLETEGVDSVAVVEPTAAFLGREHLGALAMRLRTSEVVLGPAAGGRVYLAAFAAPIDFEAVYEPPAIQTITERAAETDLDVEYLQQLPLAQSASDLAETVAQVRARRAAGRNVPARTTAMIEELGLEAVERDGGLAVARSDNA